MAKKKPWTTAWLVADENVAIQIAVHFHGPGKPGNWNYDEHLQTISDNVVGQPMKRVLGILDWTLQKEHEHKELLEAGETSEFVAANCFIPATKVKQEEF